MTTIKNIMTGLLALVCMPAGATTALPTIWGVKTASTYADCSLLFCDTIFLPVTPSTQSGMVGDTFTEEVGVNQTHNTFFSGIVDMGDTSARAQIDNTGVNVPILEAEASSNGFDGWVGSIAFALQGFEYIGTSTQTIDLSATMNGTITNNNADPITTLGIAIYLLQEDSDPTTELMFPTNPPLSVGDLVADVLAATTIVSSWIMETSTNGAVNFQTNPGDLQIELDPNEPFFVMAGQSATSYGPGNIADSFGTATMEFLPIPGFFDPATDLLASGVPIPLPPSVWLLASAIGGLTMVRRRASA